MKNKKKKARASQVPYCGPALDSAYAYASYACPTCGFEQVSNNGAAIFCFACGEPTEENSPVDYSDFSGEVEAANINSVTCPVCEVENETTASVDNPYCTQCGSAIGSGDADEESYDVDEDSADGDYDEDTEYNVEASSLYTEYLSPVNDEMRVSASDVKLDLFGENDSPFYNVTIAGNPVGRIHWADQPDAEEIRASFTTSAFAKSIAEAMEKCGPLEVLRSVNASLFAEQVEKSKLADKIRADVEEELEEDFRSKLLGLRDDYADAIAVVIAGINKNFFSDVDNPLKAAFYDRLSDLGMYAPEDLVEEVLAESGPDFFDAVMDKAQELMTRSEEAREEITAAITEANALRVSASARRSIPPATPNDAEQLKRRLAEGSNIVQIKDHMPTSPDKEELRKRLSLRG